MLASPLHPRALAALVAVALVLGLGFWLLGGEDPPPPAGLGVGLPTGPDGPTHPSGVTPDLQRPDAPPGEAGHEHGEEGPHHDHGGPPPETEPVLSTLDPVGLRGQVQGPDGQPLAGAAVAAGQLQTGAQGWTLCQSDAGGRFQLSSRELPASGLLEVSARGFATRLVPIEGQAELVVVLLPARQIAGRVVAKEDGRALADAQVEAESATWRGLARTDEAGRFALPDAPEGEEPNLFVRAEGRVAAVASPPATGELVVALERGQAVRGVVVDPQGRPVAAAVWVVPAGQLVAPHAVRADEAGRFEVWGVAPGDDVLVLAETRDAATPLTGTWQPAGEGLRVELGPRSSLTLRGAMGGELTLRAVDCPAPLPGAARALGRPRAGGKDLLVERLAAGRWQLEVDGSPRGEPIELAPGADLTVDVGALLAGEAARATPSEQEAGPCAVAVRVQDELGRPLAHVEVGVQAGGRERARQSGPDGLVRIGELPVGPVTVSAFFPGRVLVAPVYLEPTPGIPSDVTLVLTRPGGLQGRVLPPGVGAEVRVLLPDGTPLAHTRCAADGTFRLGGLPQVKLQLEVEAPDCVPIQQEVELPAPELTFTLTADPGHGTPR